MTIDTDGDCTINVNGISVSDSIDIDISDAPLEYQVFAVIELLRSVKVTSYGEYSEDMKSVIEQAIFHFEHISVNDLSFFYGCNRTIEIRPYPYPRICI